uniref:Ribos_L4_asso_C domain-containing protein n=1 Tax=Trichuris muris TaxID=70415 RepID=A0A5S6Q815_TRIMR
MGNHLATCVCTLLRSANRTAVWAYGILRNKERFPILRLACPSRPWRERFLGKKPYSETLISIFRCQQAISAWKEDFSRKYRSVVKKVLDNVGCQLTVLYLNITNIIVAVSQAKMARPLVSVYDDKGMVTSSTVKMPAVFTMPLRADLVQFVHTVMRMNRRHPYAVSKEAGHQTSAQSWGTGRAVARIPRVRGGGTHRSGQAAFGNMCRGGRMFAPTSTIRRWHRKASVTQKRYAICSAIAATGVPPLVFARGHVIDKIPELPMVISDKIEGYKKTREAVAFLKCLNAWDDIQKVYNSVRKRAGKGKMRNRRMKRKKGPLIIYNQDNGIRKAFRNIPGIEFLQVDKMNLLRLAPGGHLGRFCIWTEGAFRKLDSLYGTWKRPSSVTKWRLPMPKMTYTDFTRLIRSEEIQKAIRPRMKPQRPQSKRKDPLKCPTLMNQLNPYASVVKRSAILLQKAREVARKDMIEGKRKSAKILGWRPKRRNIKKKLPKKTEKEAKK